jgi:hypothetical protein
MAEGEALEHRIQAIICNCQCDKTDVNEFKSLKVCVNQSSCIQTIRWMSLCVVESFEWARVNVRSTQIQIQIQISLLI